MEEGETQLGELISLKGKDNKSRTMRVNAAPVYGDDGKQRGVLASFDDVTQIEQSRVELKQMLGSISASRDEIRRQNLELEQLASQDPLTSCLNRRAFFTAMETHWEKSTADDLPLSCIMIDLDHFKSINDTHGHAIGDMVLKTASALIRGGQRGGDLVCRYGGEEFCVALPKCDLDAASIVAEKIRAKLEATDFNGISVTASIGVSARHLGASDPEGMIDQADKCLYVAKRGGRNQVVRFDDARDAIAESEAAAPAPLPRSKKTPVAKTGGEKPMRPFFDSGPVGQSTEMDDAAHSVGRDQSVDRDMNDIVSEVAALGTLAERLADALDEQDFEGVATLAHRLNRIAVNNDSAIIADVTSRLEVAARDDATGTEMVQLTGELLELCTIAQQARLNEKTTSPDKKGDTFQFS
jgi:diguanylate cyclase (GGDEF)-like protein